MAWVTTKAEIGTEVSIASHRIITRTNKGMHSTAQHIPAVVLGRVDGARRDGLGFLPPVLPERLGPDLERSLGLGGRGGQGEGEGGSAGSGRRGRRRGGVEAKGEAGGGHGGGARLVSPVIRRRTGGGSSGDGGAMPWAFKTN